MQLQKVFKDIVNNLNSRDASIVANLNKIYFTGGLSKIRDIDLLASKVFKTPAQVCTTMDKEFRDPSYSPLMGVAKYVSSLKSSGKLLDINEDIVKERERGGVINSLLRFITDFV